MRLEFTWESKILGGPQLNVFWLAEILKYKIVETNLSKFELVKYVPTR